MGKTSPPPAVGTNASMNEPGAKAYALFPTAVIEELRRIIPKNTTITEDNLSEITMFETGKSTLQF